MSEYELHRIARLIREAVDDLELDLRGIRVLTEAASGPFVATAPMAALAGSDQVIAVTRDSAYGAAREIVANTRRLAEHLGCAERVELLTGPVGDLAESVNLVTNLGFVRPIDEALISRLPEDAAVTLMCEPWEVRGKDVSLDACRRRGIPVVGVNETHPRIATFRYVGLLGLKLLLESGVEVWRSRLIVVGSDPFGREIVQVLQDVGASCVRYDPTLSWPPGKSDVDVAIRECDAIVVAEHRERSPMLGCGGIPVEALSPDARIVHISGTIDDAALEAHGIKKLPEIHAPFGSMTVTTGYVGPRPVVDLHAGGLRAGADVLQAFRRSGNAAMSEEEAEHRGYALRVETGDGAGKKEASQRLPSGQ